MTFETPGLVVDPQNWGANQIPADVEFEKT